MSAGSLARRGTLGALLLVAACAPPSDAAPAPHPERLHLVAPATGHEHEVDIFRPHGPPPPGGHPSVILLDGNRVSRHLEEALRAGVRLDAVYVTVGYRGTEDFAVAQRALDYTPEVEPGVRSPDPLDPARVNGGAGHFLRFLSREVMPAVARRVALDPGARTLWGHSYGGLFVLYAMLEDPSGFSRYVAVDPSLWWRDAHLYERLVREEPRAPVDLRLLEANPRLAHGRHGRDPARVALRERLHAALPEDAFERVGTRWRGTHRYFPAHHHGSLFAESLDELLREER